MNDGQHKSSGINTSGWAWGISLGLHVILLCVLAATTLTRSNAKAENVVARASVRDSVKILADAEPLGPKPKISGRGLARITNSDERITRTLDFKTEAVNPSERVETIAPDAKISESAIRTSASQGRRIEFFGNATSERKVCFVVDCSGSMLEHWSKVQRELQRNIESLDAEHCFAIILFNSDLKPFAQGKLLRASPDNKRQAIAFIRTARPSGGTDALRALEFALKVQDAKGERPGTIYFLTDGFELDGESGNALCMKIARLRKEFADQAKIHTIGFYSEEIDRPLLETIARESGGTTNIIK